MLESTAGFGLNAEDLRDIFHDHALRLLGMTKESGDRIEDCLDGLVLDDVIAAIESLVKTWGDGLGFYRMALSGSSVWQARGELSCAEMIGLQVSSLLQIFPFHRWRLNRMDSMRVNPPYSVTLDEAGLPILQDELANCLQAVELAKADSRLGFHQEAQTWLYDPAGIQRKIRVLEASVRGHRSMVAARLPAHTATSRGVYSCWRCCG